MSTMKKFFTYFLLFVALYLLVQFFVSTLMKEDYKDITDYTIKTESPEIIVTECKAAYTNGYIKGSVTNNTDKLIEKIYIRIDLFDKDGIYLGTESKEISYFHAKETIKFDIGYNYQNVSKVEISLTDELPEEEKMTFKPDSMTDAEYKLAVGIAAILGLYVILP